MTFHNPYAKAVGPKRHSALAIPSSDYEFIQRLRPGNGTITGTAGILWQRLCATLRQYGITSQHQCGDFERFVSNCVILSADDYAQLLVASRRGGLLDGTVGGPLCPTNASDVRTGEKGPSSVPPTDATVVPNLQGGSGTGGAGKDGA